MICDFLPYFQFFAALNLAYAGSERFRNELNEGIKNFILTASSAISSKRDDIQSRAGIFKDSLYEENVITKAQKISDNFNTVTDSIESNIQVWAKFPKSFTSLFLCSAFSCIIYLLLGGLESAGKLDIDEVSYLCLSLVLVNTLYFGFLFLRSLNRTTLDKPFNPALVIFSVIFFTAIALIFGSTYFVPHINILGHNTALFSSLFIVVLPYLNHIVRAYLHRVYFIGKIWNHRRMSINKFNRLQKAVEIIVE